MQLCDQMTSVEGATKEFSDCDGSDAVDDRKMVVRFCLIEFTKEERKSSRNLFGSGIRRDH